MPKPDAAPTPPYDLDIEQATLGCVLFDNAHFWALDGALAPDDFYEPLHQRIFDIMGRRLNARLGVNPLTLNRAMVDDAGLIESGGIAYLAELAAAAPALPDVRDYAASLRDLARRRRLFAISADLLGAAARAEGYRDTWPSEPEKIAERAADDLEAVIRQRASVRNGPVALAGSALDSLKAAEEYLKAGRPNRGLTTGLRKLDKALGGLLPGDRVGVAARTGMGKSAFASVIANGVAGTGAPVFIASADMRAAQWANRALCEIDHNLNPGDRPIAYSKFRNGTLSNHEIARLATAQLEMAKWNIEIDDNPTVSVSSFRSSVRAMARRFPETHGVAIVDFLQKVQAPPDRYKDRRRDEDVTATTYALGDVVREFGWSLVVLIQLLNKATDSKGQLREDPPTVADIRESGGVEMALDIIVSPFRKAFFIERREPPGRDDPGGASGEWVTWRGEMNEHEHKMRLLGWKNRDGAASDLNLDLWCNLACAAVRDEAWVNRSDPETAALDFGPLLPVR
jgi:replicative DNA helicase